MIAVGVDVSSKKLAFASVDTDGPHKVSVWPLTEKEPARLFAQARSVAMATTRRFPGAYIFAVEIPYTPHQNFKLMGVAAVVVEAIQSSCPGAVVLDVSTGAWKKETVGFGNATKDHVLAHARAQGYEGDDQDVADALCVAEYAREVWLAEGRRAA